jgi:hypothetical protein
MNSNLGASNELEELCLRYHRDPRITYRPLKIYSKFSKRLASVIDIDETLTGKETIYKTGIRNLPRHNPELQNKTNFRILNETINNIDNLVNDSSLTREQINREINVKFGKFVFYLKKFGVNYSQIIETGLDIAMETPPRANTNKFLSELQIRGIKTALLSGSFIEWIRPWWLYKISISGVDLIATELDYSPDGSLTGQYKVTIGPGKFEPAINYIRKEGCTPELTIAVNDDFVLDGRGFLFAFGFGTIFLIGKGKKREFDMCGIKYDGDLEIVEEAADDLNILNPTIDKRIRGRTIPRIFSAQQLYELAIEGKKMRLLERKSREESGKRLNLTISEFIKSCEKIFSLQPPEILTEFIKARDLYTDLKISLYREDEINLRRQASELSAVLFNENPELQLTDDYIEKLFQLRS